MEDGQGTDEEGFNDFFFQILKGKMKGEIGIDLKM